MLGQTVVQVVIVCVFQFLLQTSYETVTSKNKTFQVYHCVCRIYCKPQNFTIFNIVVIKLSLILRFEWIEGASVTLMEIVQGVLRTKSPNCLVMQRIGDDVYDKIPSEQQIVFIEKDPQIVVSF